jgi:hypothetical protein
MSDDFENWIPSADAMRILGVSRQRLWQIAHSGDWTRWPIRAIRVGPHWQYAEDDIRARAKALGPMRTMYREQITTRREKQAKISRHQTGSVNSS